MTQKFAWMQGAKRVIAVDYLDYRMNYAKKINNVEVFEFTKFPDMGEHLKGNYAWRCGCRLLIA